MAREPQDIFIREFLEHPGWDNVWEHLQVLVRDLELQIIGGNPDVFDYRKGRLDGVYDAISHIKLLMRNYMNKG